MPGPVPAPLSDATPTRRGLMGVAAQTFSGVKTFLDAVKLAIRTTGTLPAGGAELEGSLVYDSTAKRARVHDGTQWLPVVVDASGTSPASLAEHVASEEAHPSTSITHGDSDVGTALDDKLDAADLRAVGGSALVGAPASALGPVPESFSEGTVRSHLDALLGWVNARARKGAVETITALWSFTAGLSSSGPITGTSYSGGPVSGTTGTFSGAVTGSALKWSATRTLYHYIPGNRLTLVSGSASFSGGVGSADWDASAAGTNYVLIGTTRLPPGAMVVDVSISLQTWYSPSVPTGTVTVTAGHMVKTGSDVVQVGNDQVVTSAVISPPVDTFMAWYAVALNPTRNVVPNDSYFKVGLEVNNFSTSSRIQIKDVRITYTLDTVDL